MAILQLVGGLGNQLFQYCFGRSLSLNSKKKFYINPAWYYLPKRTQYGMPFSLKEFRINCAFLPFLMNIPLEIIRRKGYQQHHLDIYKKMFMRNTPNLTVYTDYDYLSGLMPKGDSIILDGYFQDYRWFEQYRELLIREIHPRKDLNKQNESYLRQITDVNSVAIHIRRGVYITDARIRNQYPNVTLEYYQKAIEIISSKVNQPHFFIFSNDIDWVKQSFKTNSQFVIIENSGPDYEHLYLMSKCKHQIIANSTFSWWGAWLNQYQAKIVIAPKNWEKKHARIPASWVRLKN